MKIVRIILCVGAIMGIGVNADAASPSAAPDHIHLSWQQSPATTMTVMWRTSNAVTASQVQYGPTASYGNNVNGTYEALPEGRGNAHIVEITGLDPNSTYHYRVGDGGSNWSADYLFSTVSESTDMCTPVKFVAMGDSRSSTGDGASIYWSTVMDAATDEEPQFVLFNGDAIAEGDQQESGWEDWFEKAASDLRTQPMMMAWGNHEDRGDDTFLRNFALPVNDDSGTEDFYDFRVGPIHFFAMDTERVDNRWARQATWLDGKLSATDAIWTVAYHHQPTYSSGTTHGSTDECIDYWAPVFDDHHLDIDIGSHDHIYERTKPMFDESPIPNQDYSQGTMYLVTGGAGAFTNPILNIFNNFYLKGIGATHYILFEVEFNKLRLRAFSELGVAYDDYTLEKPELAYPTAAFEADRAEIYQYEAVTFNGTDSVDPCGEIIQWTWDFGDGGVGNGETVQHTYSEDGTFDVTLTVMDLDANTDSVTLTFDVLPGTPPDDDADDDADDDLDDDIDDDADDDLDDDADDDAVDDDDDFNPPDGDDDSAGDDDAGVGGDDDDETRATGDDDDSDGGCGC
ncbi:MAG: fibronectin type III domain-containing protein [Deltaproteobacteria bacterium]|nr:fibronectin type III domain-containing protein [Deltaproteobacteria bacterium]